MGTIGSKQKHIRIETPNLVSDGQGAWKAGVPPYVLRAVVWAHERPLNGKEAVRAAQLTAVLASVWEIWYRDPHTVPPGISVKDRIRYGTRVCEIEAFVDPTDERVELYLYTSEVQA